MCYVVMVLHVSFFSYRLEIFLISSQARHLLYDNATLALSLSLPATFTYTHMTSSLLSIERSKNPITVALFLRCFALSRILHVFSTKKVFFPIVTVLISSSLTIFQFYSPIASWTYNQRIYLFIIHSFLCSLA
jgi:hypothetical protein